jgi:hypothetical protein
VSRGPSTFVEGPLCICAPVLILPHARTVSAYVPADNGWVDDRNTTPFLEPPATGSMLSNRSFSYRLWYSAAIRFHSG